MGGKAKRDKYDKANSHRERSDARNKTARAKVTEEMGIIMERGKRSNY